MRIRSSAQRDVPAGHIAESGKSQTVAIEAQVHPMLVAAYDLDSKYAQDVRTIRSKIVQCRPTGKSVSHIALIGLECHTELSVLAANLGVIMARMGTPTLLVDAARSDPMIHDLMGVSNEVGVANLDSSASLAEIAHTTMLHQLWLVPAGPEPAEGGQAFEKDPIIRRLDRWNIASSTVLVSIPMNRHTNQSSVADMISGADGVVLFLRRHRTKLSDVQALIDRLDERGIAVIGSVLV